jgi:hypothetical protein
MLILKIVGHVGRTVEQDALHTFLGAASLQSIPAYELGHLHVAPVLAHFGMQKILVDSRNLGFQNFIQDRMTFAAPFTDGLSKTKGGRLAR